ncbi:MAG TPA: hypothetical protein VFG47_13005 [Geminicoccaceae bacterium]|nr:hypothetical protein [Geminicoccaceae bacterium]
MTRAEALALYRPIRAAIQRVLKRAPDACAQADYKRAARLLGLEVRGTVVLDSDREVAMLADVALFEPNQRGNRAFDRFLRTKAGRLDPADRAIADRMAGAFFSIFRVAGRHEAAGLWLEDRLDGDRGRLWLVDEAFETSAAEGDLVACRLFDAGPFHAAFGIVVMVDEETVDLCLGARRTPGQRPLGRHLVPMIYGQDIHSKALADLPVDEILGLLADALGGDPTALVGELDDAEHAGKPDPVPPSRARKNRPPR